MYPAQNPFSPNLPRNQIPQPHLYPFNNIAPAIIQHTQPQYLESRPHLIWAPPAAFEHSPAILPVSLGRYAPTNLAALNAKRPKAPIAEILAAPHTFDCQKTWHQHLHSGSTFNPIVPSHMSWPQLLSSIASQPHFKWHPASSWPTPSRILL